MASRPKRSRLNECKAMKEDERWEVVEARELEKSACILRDCATRRLRQATVAAQDDCCCARQAPANAEAATTVADAATAASSS